MRAEKKRVRLGILKNIQSLANSPWLLTCAELMLVKSGRPAKSTAFPAHGSSSSRLPTAAPLSILPSPLNAEPPPSKSLLLSLRRIGWPSPLEHEPPLVPAPTQAPCRARASLDLGRQSGFSSQRAAADSGFPRASSLVDDAGVEVAVAVVIAVTAAAVHSHPRIDGRPVVPKPPDQRSCS